MFYIVGLGNPGEKYSHTRHNVGRILLEEWAKREQLADWTKSKNANALYTHGSVGGVAVELLLPETFMNKSGDSVRYVVRKHEAKPADFIVVHDDIDLPFGEIKIGKGRGDGGNNGIKSIIQALGTKDFVRIRVGIAPTSFWTGKTKRPQGGGPLERFVLKPFSKKEEKQLEEVSERSYLALQEILKNGPEAAMNQFN